MNGIRCQICVNFFAPSLSKMVSHLVRVHKDDPGLHIVCDVPGCQSTFSKVYTYKSHVHRCHKNVDDIRPLGIGIEEMEIPDTANDNMEIVNNEVQNDDDIERSNALYLMKLKESRLLTQTSLDSVVEGTTTIVQNTVQRLRKEVEEKLRENGQEMMDIDGLSDVFDETQSLCHPFAHVRTKSQQTTYQRINFSLVVSTLKNSKYALIHLNIREFTDIYIYISK